MVQKHMKRCSTSLIIKEMKIKTTMRYPLTPVRMAMIKMSTNNKCCKGCGDKGTTLLVGMQIGTARWVTVCRFLKKLKIELPYNPAIPLPSIYLEKSMIQKDTGTPKFTAVLFTIAKIWKQPKYALKDEWIKKMWYIYIQQNITQP